MAWPLSIKKKKSGKPFHLWTEQQLSREHNMKPLKILQILLTLKETSGPYNQHSLAVSEWLAGDRLCYIPNGVNIDRVDRVIEKPLRYSPNGHYTVASVGRLIPIKNPLSVLSAFQQSADQASRLVFIGEGHLRGKCSDTNRCPPQREPRLAQNAGNSSRSSLAWRRCRAGMKKFMPR
ncbi:MAG: hypothetical protein ACRENG_21135 [bacterium]